MPLQVGGDAIGAVYAGADPIAEGWVWDGSSWSQVYSTARVGGRIIKSGAYSMPGALSWQDVLGWVPDPDVPGSEVTNEGIALTAGVPVMLSGSLDRGGTNANNGFRIVDSSGAVLAQRNANRPIIIEPFAHTPATDTVVRVMGYANSGIGSNNVIPDGPTSYLRVEAAG